MGCSELSALELGAKIKAKEIGVLEAVKETLDIMEQREPTYHCYITVCREQAQKRAKEVQKGIDNGTYTSLLAGVPMAVKDNMCTQGILTSCGSKMLSTFKPTYTSTAVKKLQDAGAVMLGKLNMDEFAMGSTGETSYFGATKNPWNVERVPGGSSGASAAAVAAQEAFYTLGSDTGGSVRQPAAFCGVTGLKPTYGAVSRYGLIAYASSLDQIGPIGKDVLDVAAVFSAIMGHDPKDSTSMRQEPMEFKLHTKAKVMDLKIGIPSEYFGEGLEAEVKARVQEAVKTLECLGAQVEEFSMPSLHYAIPTYYIAACAEASSNLGRFDGIKYGFRPDSFDGLTDLYVKARSEGFGEEVKRRILIGTFVLSSGYYDAYYKKALQVKAVIKKAFDDAFSKYDVIISPTAPTTAPKMGENLNDPLKMYLGDIYTVSVNLAGLPSLVVPCGFDKEGMPVGLQMIAKPFDEETLFSTGYSFQQATQFHKQLINFHSAKEA